MPSVTTVKVLVRHRDGDACTQCGMTGEEHQKRYGRDLDVHRTVPGSVYAIEGCVTVCKECHGPLPKREPGTPDEGNPNAGYFVRLPEEFRPVLENLQAKNDRPMTIEVQRALIAYAKQQGVPSPEAPILNGRRKEK